MRPGRYQNLNDLKGWATGARVTQYFCYGSPASASAFSSQ